MTLGKYRGLVLLLGDACILWLGLGITLLVRYGSVGLAPSLEQHVLPFGVIFVFWLLVFHISGLYEIRRTSEFAKTLKLILYAIGISGVIAMSLFYFVELFVIAPKGNLIIDLGITAILLTVWRFAFTQSIKRSSKINVMLLGSSADIEELAEAIYEYPQFGYRIAARAGSSQEMIDFLKKREIDVVVAPKELQSDEQFVHAMYDTLHRGIRFIDAATFYETVMGKIPIAMISKSWFLENIAETEKNFFESAKRGCDILFSLALGTVAFLLFPLVAIFIKLDSRGPIFIKQKRVGRRGTMFYLYKYRTMFALGPDGLAEQNGAQWAEKSDSRVTRVGSFLRSTRIDELPQMWNVLRGELSFIGPRPERPEFVESLRKEIPYYDMRHLIRPGLSGWAQVNPPYYYGTRKEAMIKLQYDLFYIKNRDLGLDLDIALKTLAVILSRQGR